VRRGDLVEVTLRNEDVEDGVSVHWHGVDVPNAEDGVAGVTQDAVAPGGRHTYRFRVEQEGTFWYHTHQSSAKEVRRGLYGALVIEPPEQPAADVLDLAVVAHQLEGIPALNDADTLQRRAVAPGTRVRLRLVDADSTPQRLTLTGTPFRVVAIDGTDLSGPTPLEDVSLELAGGGRYDVAFTMPDRPVELAIPDTDAALALSPDGRGRPPRAEPGPDFDPLAYGRPAATPFDADSRFDRTFTFRISKDPGFIDGRPGRHWSINGRLYPDVPMFVVREGDLVKVTLDNNTSAVHPMHLHGHHMLVLSRDGVPVSGSPWWSDTLNMQSRERYEVAFRADNPGLWMDHCHNLRHATEGLTMHVAYEGVGTPFTVGGAAHNHPE
jgi:FtsP/CotA-like multicopper oxidase with cupredoxin domain